MSASSGFRGPAGATCEVPVGALYDAVHDGLTSLLNRDAWWFGAMQAVVAGSRGPLLILDVDHFKNWNDRYGHPTGDKALAAIAGVLRAELRNADLIGRWGMGDEFIVLLSGEHDAASAVAVGERLRRAVADLRVELPDGAERGPTVSIGAAVRSAGEVDLDRLIASADRELYRVKRAGRDGVGVVAVRDAGPRPARIGAARG